MPVGDRQPRKSSGAYARARELCRQVEDAPQLFRVLLGLARFYAGQGQRQGKRTAARELLAPIYGWFTEGFDAADLQEAGR